jgi:hypothetical protein
MSEAYDLGMDTLINLLITVTFNQVAAAMGIHVADLPPKH